MTTTISGATFTITTKEAFVAQVMDRKAKFSVAMIEEALESRGIDFRKKDSKEMKAEKLYHALKQESAEMNVKTERPAAVDRPVAANHKKEETSMQMNLKPQNRHMNPATKEMMDKVNAAKDAYLRNIGENAIIVEYVEFYPGKDEATREEIRERRVKRSHQTKTGLTLDIVGEVIVRIPPNYMQIKVWNKNLPNKQGKLGAPEWVEFKEMDLDLTKGRYDIFQGPVEGGEGLLAMNIIELTYSDGTKSGLTVSLPTESNKKNPSIKYDLFKTSDARFAKTKDTTKKDEPMYLADNNDWFSAQVSAFVQMFAEEFVQVHPGNHPGFEKKHCSHMIRFGTKDGVTDDINAESRKNRVILEQPDVMQLAQVGSEQPRTYCSVRDIWLDEGAVETFNEIDKMERGDQALDHRGELRFPRHDEVIIAGKIVKRNTVRDTCIEEICATCPFYCGNSPKSDAQVTKEKTEKPGAYVNPFFRERPKAAAQAFQTLVRIGDREEWVTKHPAEVINEVDDILNLRVKSAGLSVYGSEEVIGAMNPEYVVPVEEFDARRAGVMKKINQIFHFAFNMDDMSEEQAEYIFTLVENKPEDLTEREEKKWDNAIFWLAQALQWAEENEKAKHIAPFKTVFHAGVKEGTVELHVEDVMSDTLFRAEAGTLAYGLGYEDLTPKEFVRFLDEVSVDLIYSVIEEGTEYSIVGGTEKDKELAAGALQEMLQSELLWTFISNIRRSEDPAEALEGMKIADSVRDYMKAVLFN